MNKKILSLILVSSVVFSFCFPVPLAQAYSAQGPYLTARSLVVYDPAQSRILYSKTPHARRPPASTTKILTALVVLEKKRLDDVITIRKDTAHVPRTKINVRTGERFRVKDLLKALLISSANDVAVVLAYHIAGSERAFANLMNRRAKRIGCRNTHFVNPHGLPADAQYSTSFDLALIMNEARKYPFLMQTLATKKTYVRSLGSRRFFLKNHNKMLWRDPRPIIGKTGFTRRALYCFVGRINYRSRDVMVAIMGSIRPWRDLKALLDFYNRISIQTQNKVIVQNGKAWTRRRMKIFEAALKRSGFNPGKIDGVVTSQTIQAVRAFQKKHKIPQTGFIGPLTSKALKKFT